MSADYTDGYNDGYAAGESAGKRSVEAIRKKCEGLEQLIQAAAKVIEAYGEDEGYSPSRVETEISLLTKAGWL